MNQNEYQYKVWVIFQVDQSGTKSRCCLNC